MTRRLRIDIPLPALLYSSVVLLLAIGLWVYWAGAANYDDEQDIVMI